MSSGNRPREQKGARKTGLLEHLEATGAAGQRTMSGSLILWEQPRFYAPPLAFPQMHWGNTSAEGDEGNVTTLKNDETEAVPTMPPQSAGT